MECRPPARRGHKRPTPRDAEGRNRETEDRGRMTEDEDQDA